MQNFFEVLGVTLDATDADVRRSYYNLAREHHPDKDHTHGDTFLLICRAYEGLQTESSRRNHAKLLRKWPVASTATLANLRAKPAYNGARVSVRGFNGRRYEVQLLDGTTISVRPDSLVPHTPSQATASAWASPTTAWATASAFKGTSAWASSTCYGESVGSPARDAPCQVPATEPRSEQEAQNSDPWATPQARVDVPRIPLTPWTEDEVCRARNLNLDRRSPARDRADMYSAVDDATAYPLRLALMMEELLVVARVFQLAMQMQRDLGLFSQLEARIDEHGKGGMCAQITTDWHRDGVRHQYCEKTAGDVLQCFWCKVRAVPHSHQFGYNKCQASISEWLSLPFLVFKPKVAVV